MTDAVSQWILQLHVISDVQLVELHQAVERELQQRQSFRCFRRFRRKCMRVEPHRLDASSSDDSPGEFAQHIRYGLHQLMPVLERVVHRNRYRLITQAFQFWQHVRNRSAFRTNLRQSAQVITLE